MGRRSIAVSSRRMSHARRRSVSRRGLGINPSAIILSKVLGDADISRRIVTANQPGCERRWQCRLSCDTCQCRLALARARRLRLLCQFSVHRPMHFLVLTPQRWRRKREGVDLAATGSVVSCLMFICSLWLGCRDGADAATVSAVDRRRAVAASGRAARDATRLRRRSWSSRCCRWSSGP